MADYVLHLAQEENIVLGAGSVRRLIEGRDGNAALLYLSLARSGSSDAEKLRAELGWNEAQFAAAEAALRSMGLIQSPAPARPAAPPARTQSAPPPETALPEYSREDVMDKLERDASFAAVLREVERKLGRLSEPSVRKLLGLYDYLGLSADVIFLLVNYCAERKAEQFGAGKLPTLRDIEKEGYAWARMELFSYAAADAFVQREREKRGRYPEYMEVLRLGSRAPVASEERFLKQWAEWGFPPETVEIAYDKTMLNCHELKWTYCNGILKKWHEKGLHTPEEARSENLAPRVRETPKRGGSKNAWMKDYD